MQSRKSLLEVGRPLTVGSVGNTQSLLNCDAKTARRCDVVEIRLDLLHAEGESWREGPSIWELWEMPLLFTARVPAEGGKCEISNKVLCEMARMGKLASMWDVELNTWRGDEKRRDALLRGWDGERPTLVLSFHDFSATPDLDTLRHLRDSAIAANADVFKVATYLNQESDMEKLLALQEEKCSIAIATMGMGMYGAESRVRCALAGSLLNYGYLGDVATAPGQWEAGRLREAIVDGTIPITQK